jgi:hypothetical protein
MAGLLKRFRAKETSDTTDAIDESPQIPTIRSAPSPDSIEKDTALSSSRDIQEIEANQKLAAFERAHRWDPNLDDEQLHEIDDVVNARDPNSEAKIYDEVFENSPYPEVCPIFFPCGF